MRCYAAATKRPEDLTNGPLSCDRAIRYSGFFGVRETWVLSEISLIPVKSCIHHDAVSRMLFVYYLIEFSISALHIFSGNRTFFRRRTIHSA